MTLDHSSGKSEFNNVEYISIDLWNPYKRVAQTYFPKAIICADSFHVIENLTKLFREVRLRMRKNTEDENIKYLLTKFKFIFNHGINLDNEPKFNKRFNRYMNYRDMQEIAFNLFPELKKAYDLKESYILFNQTSTIDNAKEELCEQIRAFGESGVKEYL